VVKAELTDPSRAVDVFGVCARDALAPYLADFDMGTRSRSMSASLDEPHADFQSFWQPLVVPPTLISDLLALRIGELAQAWSCTASWRIEERDLGLVCRSQPPRLRAAVRDRRTPVSAMQRFRTDRSCAGVCVRLRRQCRSKRTWIEVT
jgi:hypothetical protein